MKHSPDPHLSIAASVLAITIALSPTPVPAATDDAAPGPVTYRVDILIPGSAMHGVHGLAFDKDDELYGASLAGYSIYHIDRQTGAVTTTVGPPLGNSDDLAFGPDGTLAWTAGAFSSIFARAPGGEIRTLADGLGGVNSINFSPDGRLYITRVFGGDHLYEIDLAGKQAPRLIAKKLGGLNGFEVTADNTLYGPLFFKKKIIRVDLASGEVHDVATGFGVPAAVNIDQHGNLYVVDYKLGQVTRIRLADGDREVLVELQPPLDNLAIDSRGFIYVSNPAFNRITEIDPETRHTRIIVEGRLSSPGGLALDGDRLFIADFWGSRFAALGTGAITMYDAPDGVTASSSVAASDRYYALAGIWPFGVVYVIDRSTHKLVKRARVGAPYGLVFLADDSLLVADYKGGQVLQLAPGKTRDKTVIVADLAGPVGLVYRARDDTLFISEFDAGRVIAIDRASGERRTVVDNLAQPEGLALDNDGRLLITETGRNRVWAVAADGTATVIATGIPMGLAGGDDLPAPFLPSSLAVDQANRIYVTSDVENAVYRLTAD